MSGMLFNVDAEESADFISMNPDGSGFRILQDSVAFEVAEDGKTIKFHSKDGTETLSLLPDGSTVIIYQDTSKENIPDNNEEVFIIVDQHPQYPGGDEARLEFLRNNIVYPAEAKEQGIQGTVYIGFIVEKDGTVSNVKIVRGVHKLIDDEAIRATKLMPNWIPGIQKGKVVRVSYNMPIKFTIPAVVE
jgi:TonB family protein